MHSLDYKIFFASINNLNLMYYVILLFVNLNRILKLSTTSIEL